MNSQEIRQAFLDFFEERGHTFVPSSSLVPMDDPTLLFTNAGMNQFKAVLLGQEKRDYVRAANSPEVHARERQAQRPGGGGSRRPPPHLLRDARQLVLRRLLQGEDHRAGPGNSSPRRWGSTAEQAAGHRSTRTTTRAIGIWNEDVGVPAERIYRLGDIEKGDEENFWSMGDTGPCGPCTEIHFDQGPRAGRGRRAAPLGENDSDRYLEIWNLVFIQYDRDDEGKLSPAAPAERRHRAWVSSAWRR